MSTILILHGWGSQAKNWQKVKEGLEKVGYKVFVPDLPGFGENTPLERAWITEDLETKVMPFEDALRQMGAKNIGLKGCRPGQTGRGW